MWFSPDRSCAAAAYPRETATPSYVPLTGVSPGGQQQAKLAAQADVPHNSGSGGGAKGWHGDMLKMDNRMLFPAHSVERKHSLIQNAATSLQGCLILGICGWCWRGSRALMLELKISKSHPRKCTFPRCQEIGHGVDMGMGVHGEWLSAVNYSKTL